MTGDALLVFGTGLLGGYTTFSTWIFEAQRLGEDGDWIAMWVSLLGSMLAGVATTGPGLAARRGARMNADALKLSVYFGDAVVSGPRLAADALMRRLAARRMVAAALVPGIERVGINRRIHAQRFPDVSTDLPLLAMAVDERDRIRAVLEDVDRAVPRGVVTLEHPRLATGEDGAGAEIPTGPVKAAKLTIYCGSDDRADGRPAFRAAVDALRRSGASGAIVLAGVDGVLSGRRRRARLFRIRGAPMVIISVGPARPLRSRSRSSLSCCRGRS